MTMIEMKLEENMKSLNLIIDISLSMSEISQHLCKRNTLSQIRIGIGANQITIQFGRIALRKRRIMAISHRT